MGFWGMVFVTDARAIMYPIDCIYGNESQAMLCSEDNNCRSSCLSGATYLFEIWSPPYLTSGGEFITNAYIAFEGQWHEAGLYVEMGQFRFAALHGHDFLTDGDYPIGAYFKGSEGSIFVCRNNYILRLYHREDARADSFYGQWQTVDYPSPDQSWSLFPNGGSQIGWVNFTGVFLQNVPRGCGGVGSFSLAGQQFTVDQIDRDVCGNSAPSVAYTLSAPSGTNCDGARSQGRVYQPEMIYYARFNPPPITPTPPIPDPPTATPTPTNTPTPVPCPNISHTCGVGGTIALDWNDISGAGSYEVKRDSTVVANPTVSNYTDMPTCNTSYLYNVKPNTRATDCSQNYSVACACPTPVRIVAVSGRVVNQATGANISGAGLVVNKKDVDSCSGGNDSGCNPQYPTSSSSGWSSTCINNPMNRIKVVLNTLPAGYAAGNFPAVPAACSVWSNTTVCCNPTGLSSLANIVFYATAGTATPTPTGVATPTPTSSVNRNQICDPIFLKNRQVKFEVVGTSGIGGSNIDEVSVRMKDNGGVYLTATAGNLTGVMTSSITATGAGFTGSVTTSVAGNNRTVVFPVNFLESFRRGTYSLETYVEDKNGQNSGWVDTGRWLRIWDCKVGISGKMYDGSDAPGGLIACPNSGFTNLASVEMGFASLVYEGAGVAADKSMSVTVPDSYGDGGNKLIWGESYTADLGSINGSGEMMRLNASGVYSCPGSVNVDRTLADPYVDDPSFEGDFSALRYQDPWFQTENGSVMARTRIRDDVPVSCANDSQCRAAMTIGVGGSNRVGIVAAPTIDNLSGCGSLCSYGWPYDWSSNANLLKNSYGYKYFYDEVYVKQKMGVVYGSGTSMSQIVSGLGGTGIALVNGDVTVDTSNTVAVGNFLMIVASGGINIGTGVSQVEGVLAADGLINASGISDSQLAVNGVLFSAGGNVLLSRNFTNSLASSTTPPVVVRYRPDFIFSLPQSIVIKLEGWREGL